MKALLYSLIAYVPSLAALDPFAQHNDEFSLALKSAIAALSSAVVFMFFWFRSSYRRIENKLDARDKERVVLKQRLGRLESMKDLLASCPLEHCPYRGVGIDEEDESGD